MGFLFLICSVLKSCPNLCDPTNYSMPGFPVLHCLPEFCSNSCPLSRWCHPTISSSVAPFSSCFQSFPASGAFLMSRLFASGIGASASASVHPRNIQGWFPLGLTGLMVHFNLWNWVHCTLGGQVSAHHHNVAEHLWWTLGGWSDLDHIPSEMKMLFSCLCFVWGGHGENHLVALD